MKTSNEGLTVLKYFESCELEAYRDGGGVLTIGWGHTGPEVKPGLVWSQAQADTQLNSDLAGFERDVTTLVKTRITQTQFDALVCFAFNCGADIDADSKAEGLGDSTLLRFVNTGRFAEAADEFPKWCNDNGKPVLGLRRRRAAERALFIGLSAKRALAVAQAIK